jgi:hypothetical protein
MDEKDISHLTLVTSEGEQVGKAEKTRGQPVQRHIKRRVALELRAAGLTYEQVAEQMKVMGHRTSAKGVRQIIERALEDMAQHDQQNVQLIRQMDVQRLDQLMAVLWPKVKAGDIKAIREYRQIVDQRSRLLGTYAAKQVEIRGKIEGVLSDEDREEIKRLEQAFLASGAGGDDDVVVDAEAVEVNALPAPPPA